MKVQVKQEELVAAIATAKRAVSNRATLPVLSGVRIEANGRLEVSATDLETTIRANVDVTADEEGAVVVAGKLLEQTVKGMKGQTLRISAQDGELQIDGDKGTYRLKAMATEDYPSLPDVGAVVAEIDAQELATALERALVAVATDETRQVLCGVCFDFGTGNGEQLEIAATDSYRLTVSEVTYNLLGTVSGRYVVPARPLKELLRALKGCDLVTIAVSDDQYPTLTFSAGGVRVGARTTQGEFPNYRQLIPQGYQNVATIDAAEMLATVKRVAVYAQNNLPVKLNLWDVLEVSASTPDVGEASETVSATFSGDPLVIAFNPAFLEQGIAACKSERVSILAADGLKPAIIRPAGCPHADGFIYLLMPVRLS